MTMSVQTCSVMTAPRPWKDLGDRIRAAREAAGLSRRELSIRINTAEHSIYRWEGGLHRPDTDNLFLIAQACGVTVDQLMGRASAQQDMHGVPGALESFLATTEGRTVSDAERVQLLTMPWDKTPSELSFHYALQALRNQQNGDEAVASAEETEEMLRRGLSRGRRVLSDDESQEKRISKPRKR